jgi:hypothetical protein
MAEWGSIERQLRPQSEFFPNEGVSPGVSDMKPALYQLIEYTIFCRWLQALFEFHTIKMSRHTKNLLGAISNRKVRLHLQKASR